MSTIKVDSIEPTDPANPLEISTSGGTDADVTVDTSGNVLVGKTTTDADVVGVELGATGYGVFTRDSNKVAIFNRNTNDGTILEFLKNGNRVGTIGNASGASVFYLSGPENGIKLIGPVATGVDSLAPCNSTGQNRDNQMDLGFASARFDDIFATNGTIQTSDANEKQAIASLTAPELEAAKAISKLFKNFKWNASVKAKTKDKARTHTGVIAQEVEQAMADAGLDAGNYAFFISTDWVDEETGEERNRKGIRYPQLLSFVAAATEQRLASIEARLDLIEGAQS